MSRDHDCDALGLTDDQRAALGGFTWRTVRALAHLREAWCGADPGNRADVEQSLRALLNSHSLREIPRACAVVLAHGLDGALAARLLRSVGLEDVPPGP
jgi:hypothetical protein